MSGEHRGEWQDWPFEPLVVLRALHERGVEYVLLGGVAAVLQGSPLPTYDIDIAPAPGAANRARLLAALADIDGALLTDGGSDDAGRRLAEQGDVSFFTPFGYVDVHHRPAGFRSYAELRRASRPIRLERDLSVQASSLRDIIRSRLAAGDDRQLPALEAALEMESGS